MDRRSVAKSGLRSERDGVYRFYEVVAAAVVYIIGNLILGVLTLQGTGTISTLQLIGWFPVLLVTFVAPIYVLLKVPSLTHQIFSGSAGGTSAGILEAIAEGKGR